MALAVPVAAALQILLPEVVALVWGPAPDGAGDADERVPASRPRG